MPDFFNVVRSQRGTAYYKPDPIPDDVLDQMLEAATRAPSGSNRQPWRFIVVRDREMKRQLGELYREGQAPGFGLAADQGCRERCPCTSASAWRTCPVLVMVCVELMGDTYAAETYRGASIYPAAQNLMLAAAALGIGTRLTTIWQHCYDGRGVAARRAGRLGDDRR